MKIINLAKDIQWMEPLIDTATAGCTLISLNPSGTGDASLNLQPSKTVNPSTAFQTVYPDQGYNALGSVTLNAVTASIDSNISPENIVEGASILGVQGTAKAFGSYGFGDLGYDDQEAFEAYTAWILSTGGDETGLAQAIYDASTAYAALDNPMDLTPQQFSDLIDDSNKAWAHLKLMPKIAIGSEHHAEESWPVKPYEDCFKNFFAVYYPAINITAPASGVSLNRMFQNNKNVIYIHSISFPEESVGDSPVTCNDMFNSCSNLREIHVSEGRGSIFDNRSIVSAQAMFGYGDRVDMHFTAPDLIVWPNCTTVERLFGSPNNGGNSFIRFPNGIAVRCAKCTDFSQMFRGIRFDSAPGSSIILDSSAAVTSFGNIFRQTSNIPDIRFEFNTAAFNIGMPFSMSKGGDIYVQDGWQDATGGKIFAGGYDFTHVGEAGYNRSGRIYSGLATQGLDLSSCTSDGLLNFLDYCGTLYELNGIGPVKYSFRIGSKTLNAESVDAIIGQVYDFASAGEDSGNATIYLRSDVYNRLSEENKAAASAKLWSIATY